MIWPMCSGRWRMQNQSALYTSKAALYDDVINKYRRADLTSDLFSATPEVRAKALRRYYEYFHHVFVDYYFEMIEAVRQGDPYLAKEILDSKYRQSRDDQGRVKDELVVSQEAYDAAIVWIDKAKAVTADKVRAEMETNNGRSDAGVQNEIKRRREAIADEMEQELLQVSSQMIDLFVDRAPAAIARVEEMKEAVNKVKDLINQAFEGEEGQPYLPGYEQWVWSQILEILAGYPSIRRIRFSKML